MMGIYPDNPGDAAYMVSSPVFDKVEITLDPRWYKKDKLVIETVRPTSAAKYIKGMTLGGKSQSSYRIAHRDLVNAGILKMVLEERAQ